MTTHARPHCWFYLLLIGGGFLSSLLRVAANESSSDILFADNFTHSLEQWSVEQMPGGRVAVQAGALVIEDVGGTTVWFRPRLVAPIVQAMLPWRMPRRR